MDHFLAGETVATLLSLNTPSTEVFLLSAFLLLLHVFIWTTVSLSKKRADVADIAWGLGFFVVAWSSFLLSAFSYPSLLITLMVTLWSLRLSIHIARRNWNRKEDFRYEELKQNWTNHFRLRLLLQVFLLQGVILYIIALPILWINTHPQEISWNTLQVAFPIWLAAFLIEAIADVQLLQFQKKRESKGKLLTTGLWGFVRHPNYLGEIIQWWVFWILSAHFFLLISPLLITFLIVKVSGIAPLEKKMQNHPDFPKYAATTPSLIPFSLVNGALYTLGWILIVYWGGRDSNWIPLTIFCVLYGTQLFLFSRYEKKSLPISPILSIYALFFGFVQEMVLTHAHLLHYPHQGFFPPLWLLSLYPLFALNLNCSLLFINNNLFLSFFLGGGGALLSYFCGEKFGSVSLLSPFSYGAIFVSWGLYLSFIVWVNRHLKSLWLRYTDPTRLETPLRVFFDEKCPVCAAEMRNLKKRRQTGKILYDSIRSEQCVVKYEEAIKKIHAMDANGNLFTGIDALSEIYARSHLLSLAILLQAPLLRPLFHVAYTIWAKLRQKVA